MPGANIVSYLNERLDGLKQVTASNKCFEERRGYKITAWSISRIKRQILDVLVAGTRIMSL